MPLHRAGDIDDFVFLFILKAHGGHLQVAHKVIANVTQMSQKLPTRVLQIECLGHAGSPQIPAKFQFGNVPDGVRISAQTMELSSDALPDIGINKRKPVQGLSLTITCTSDVAITGAVTFTKDNVTKGICFDTGRCGSGVSRYTVTQNRQQKTSTLTIHSVVSSEDNGTWICIQDRVQPSAGLNLSQFASVLDWSSMTYNPSLTSLPSSVTPQDTITVTATTPCAAPAAVITWTYPQGVSGSPPSNTSSSPGSCPSGQVQTTNTLTLPGNTASLYNKQISLTVRVEHDSFDPPTYNKSQTTNVIQFPVPVTMVTMTNINSDNQKVGQQVGESLTLTCVTSACFPTSTVTWSGLPSGTTPTVTGETTSGVLVKTTSSVTFTFSRNDDGNVIQCVASNINGQSSPQSNRAILEVWYGPDTNQISVTKPPSVEVVEKRNLTLTCETLTSVSPGVTFTWDYSDGSAITGGSTGAVIGSAGNTWSQTRTFQPIRSKTSVRCRVNNTRISMTATGTLSLDVKWMPGTPSIPDFPSPMYSGDQQTITCTVTGGNPLADITWSCYNTSNTGSESTTPRTSTREGSKTSSLTFLVTKQQNGQQCQCRATWAYGEYDQSATETFNVYYPPDKPTTTTPGSLCEGKSTSLTCSSSDPGNPPATFYWTKNTSSMATGSPFTFTPGRDDHQAQIKCEAGNNHTDRSGHSRPQSDVRQLNVYYIPRITISPATDQTRKEGQSLSLNCSADSNPDNATLSWTFNGTNVTGVSVEKTNLSRSDHGVYTCTGRVDTGSVCPGRFLQGQGTISINVNYSPDLILSSVTSNESQSATVSCQADGRPENFNFSSFVHTWRGHVIRHVTGEKKQEKFYQKEFASSSYQDSGVYVCEVGNGVPDRQGVTQHKGNISVQINASPKLTFGMDEVSMVGVEVGENTTLFRTFYSQTRVTSYTWSKEGQTLNNTLVSDTTVQLDIYGIMVKDEGHNLTLNIGLFDKDTDLGQYNLQVCNSFGCESSSINLTAAGPPLTPKQFQIQENTTQTSIWLSWKPNFPGGDYTQMFIVEYRMQGGQWKELVPFIDTEEDVVVVEVNSLSPGTLYEFRVYAKNTRETKNRSEYTDILQEATKKDEPPGVDGALIGGAVGASAAIIFVVIVVAVLIVRKRRAGKKDDGSKLALHENLHGGKREEPEMHDNVLYDTSEGAQGFEKPVMEDNVLYAGSGDIGRAASSGGAEYAVVQKKPNAKKNKEKTNGDIYATPQKKSKTTQKKGENESDLYALPQKKDKENDKKAEKKKDKKKDKKDDKKQANLRKQKRGDVYENTVPGQFGSEAEASTYANAGFVGDENHYEETAGATANAETPAYGRDEDGLLYVGIDFGNQKPSQEVHGDEDSTEYAGIAFGKVGPPLPPDEEGKDEEKK